MMYDFFAGFGFATFLIYGWQILYEIVRHKSMLENQFPDVPVEFIVFAGAGFVIWVACSYVAGAP